MQACLHTPLTLLLSFSLFFHARRYPSPWQVVAGDVFFGGVPCLLFLGLLTQACFAFLLRFAHSFHSPFFQARGHPSPWQVVAGDVFFGGGYPASSFWGFLCRLASLSCFALHTPLTLFLGLLAQACFAFLLRFAHSFDAFAFILPFFLKHAGILHLGRWWQVTFFFGGVPCLLFLGLLAQACFAFLLRFAHSFDSFAFILLFFQARGHPSPWQVVAGDVSFLGYPASSFWGFLRRLASLSCFALHTPLTLLLSFSLFFQARGHPSPWQVVAGGVFFGVPCLLFLGLLAQACFAFLLRFAHSFDSFAFILPFFKHAGILHLGRW